MIGLLQRVRHARVDINSNTVASIDGGLLVFVGVEKGDKEEQAERLLERLLAYRVFADSEGKMNHSVRDVKGGLLLVPQFTLAADTRKGMRPGFSTAASPELGETLYSFLLDRARAAYDRVASGVFGADMQVSLQNDGPVTFILRS